MAAPIPGQPPQWALRDFARWRPPFPLRAPHLSLTHNSPTLSFPSRRYYNTRTRSTRWERPWELDFFATAVSKPGKKEDGSESEWIKVWDEDSHLFY